MHSETQRKLAEKQINRSILISAGCGAIPVPIIDIASTTMVQMNMIKNLCEIFEVKWDENVVKGFLGTVLGNLGKRMGTSVVKSIPFIGPILGGAANAVLSGVSTYAIGNAFVKYVSVNSTIKSVKDIDVTSFGKMYDNFSKQADSVTNMLKNRLRSAWRGEEEPAVAGAPKESIAKYGERVFKDKDKYHAWLNKPNPVIGGRKPFELLLSEDHKEQEQVRRLIDLHVEGKKKTA